MNEQGISCKKRKSVPEKTFFDIVDIFQTIQGEGPFLGHPATFIRLAGCNLQCPFCDTDYTSNSKRYSVFQITEELSNEFTILNKLIVITGGEPFRQDAAFLANYLIKFGFTVQIETNGTIAPSEKLHDDITVVCSPKTPKLDKELEQRIDCYKYVIEYDNVSSEDGLPINSLGYKHSRQIARPREGVPVYVTPLDRHESAMNCLNIQETVRSAMKYGYIFNLQMHKFIGVK